MQRDLDARPVDRAVSRSSHQAPGNLDAGRIEQDRRGSGRATPAEDEARRSRDGHLAEHAVGRRAQYHRLAYRDVDVCAGSWDHTVGPCGAVVPVQEAGSVVRAGRQGDGQHDESDQRGQRAGPAELHHADVPIKRKADR
eukprot:scaffold9778_cov111-Isochrysis_galbana.AAC.4